MNLSIELFYSVNFLSHIIMRSD